MSEASQKTKKYESVRIWGNEKKELLEVVLEKSKRSGKRVTEVQETSAAIKEYCKKEKRKLGI